MPRDSLVNEWSNLHLLRYCKYSIYQIMADFCELPIVSLCQTLDFGLLCLLVHLCCYIYPHKSIFLKKEERKKDRLASLCLWFIYLSLSGDSASSHAVHLICLWGRHSECSILLPALLHDVVTEMDSLAHSTYLTGLCFAVFQSHDPRLNEGLNVVICM